MLGIHVGEGPKHFASVMGRRSFQELGERGRYDDGIRRVIVEASQAVRSRAEGIAALAYGTNEPEPR